MEVEAPPKAVVPPVITVQAPPVKQLGLFGNKNKRPENAAIKPDTNGASV
jgi:hypothetical protein